ncbi:MAG: gamma-glutamyl-gamma-aminobutyrate hydrolase family protein [Acidobacteria bacterium]|nr:gamma-glutamyl-gamma-aminobutyrate hydrolase family protein [Acidobacteriota bacterium]
MKRPLIALPMRFSTETDNFYLRRHYAEALYQAGATPIYVPLIPESIYIEDLISRCDGVVLTGSHSDVDPARYGREPHPQLGPVIWARDEVDMLLLKAAEERQLPVLATCFGMQSLTVYRGGTLLQDIPSQVQSPIKHQQGAPSEPPSHSIRIKPDSILAQLAGGIRAQVNSHHHQAVDSVGQGLEPMAWAPDGVIEAVVNTKSEQLIMAVQWHPELSFDSDPFSRDLFAWFVARVEQRRS